MEPLQGPTGNDFRVLQIHPTLRCNLKCPHCYSASGPRIKQELPLDLLTRAVSDAHAEGYNVVSFSGGEPLMYRPLQRLLEHARSLGLITSITTNGMLITAARMQQLRGALDLIAISLDGVEASHNQMRGNSKAFAAMKHALDHVRDAGVPFGFIFTLTLFNLDELEEVASFAAAQGAALLQVHPLEEVGRAQELLADSAPDELELTYAYVEAARIQKMFGDKLRVQFDVVDRELIRDQPARVYAIDGPDQEIPVGQPLAALVSPLVIEDDGTVVPIQYGFSRSYAAGNLHKGTLKAHAAHWKSTLYKPFLQLCRNVFSELLAAEQSHSPFVNWYGKITRASYEFPSPGMHKRLPVAQLAPISLSQ